MVNSLNVVVGIMEILKRYDRYSLPNNSCDIFTKMLQKLIRNALNFKKLTRDEMDIMDIFCEKEILFFDPQTDTITPNSRIYPKAMEDL